MQQKLFDEQVIAFMEQFMKTYLEERDHTAVLKLLHPGIVWNGAGVQATSCDYEEIKQMLTDECRRWCRPFIILNQQYRAIPLSDTEYMVHGEVRVEENEFSTFYPHEHLRLSVLCIREMESFKIRYMHCAVLIPPGREALVDNIAGGVQICNFDSKFTIQYVNSGFCQMTGYAAEEVLNCSHIGLVYHEDLQKMQEEINNQIADSNRFSVEYRMVKKDGTLIWVVDRGTIFFENGKPARTQCVLTDITLYKRQEEELRIGEQRYLITMKQLDVSMYEYDIEQRRLMLFENDANLYAVPTVVDNGPEVLIKMGAILPDFVEGYREMYRKIHAGEQFANCFINTRDTEGTIHEYELSMTTIYDTEGKPLRAVGVKKDISQMRHLQREQKFGETMIQDKSIVLDADVINDTVSFIADELLPREKAMGISYSKVVAIVAEEQVKEEYREHVLNQLSVEHIHKQYEQGERQFAFRFMRKEADGEYYWYETTVSMVRDEFNGNISIRIYHANISQRKKKEQDAEKERLLYESMVAKATVAYELNLSKDLIIKGHELWEEKYGLKVEGGYNVMIAAFCDAVVYSDDQEAFYHTLERSVLIRAFNKQEREHECTYRKREEGRGPRWFSCVVHLYEDPDSGEIRGYGYVEDIDEEKREELALKYRAEHDAMTGLYNKETFTQIMESVLKPEDISKKKHALLIVDIDNFKSINDNFGHLFGDQVITKIGMTLKNSFRSNDFVGRVGGDEFCAAIMDMSDIESVLRKAQQICDNIRHTYSRGDVSCSISASVGIAVYPEDGEDFEHLFQHADEALYMAKQNGRNRYVYK